MTNASQTPDWVNMDLSLRRKACMTKVGKGYAILAALITVMSLLYWYGSYMETRSPQEAWWGSYIGDALSSLVTGFFNALLSFVSVFADIGFSIAKPLPFVKGMPIWQNISWLSFGLVGVVCLIGIAIGSLMILYKLWAAEKNKRVSLNGFSTLASIGIKCALCILALFTSYAAIITVGVLFLAGWFPDMLFKEGAVYLRSFLGSIAIIVLWGNWYDSLKKKVPKGYEMMHPKRFGFYRMIGIIFVAVLTGFSGYVARVLYIPDAGSEITELIPLIGGAVGLLTGIAVLAYWFTCDPLVQKSVEKKEEPSSA